MKDEIIKFTIKMLIAAIILGTTAIAVGSAIQYVETEYINYDSGR